MKEISNFDILQYSLCLHQTHRPDAWPQPQRGHSHWAGSSLWSPPCPSSRPYFCL